MAITLSTDWKVYNDQVQASYAERVAQNLSVLIEKGNGAIIVEDAAAPGDYMKKANFKMPSGLVSRRVVTGTGATASATAVTVSQGENVEVRLSRKIGPVEMTRDTLRRAGITQDTFSMYLGEMIADAVLQQELNDALLACRGAVAKTATLNDISSATVSTITRQALATGMQKLGDAQSQIVAFVGHSKVYGDLMTEALTATAGANDILTQVAIYGASAPTMNRPFFVTDSSSLILDETVDKYFTLGLTQGAIRLRLDTQLSDIVVQDVTGLENLTLRIQGERDWFLGIKGYTWDTNSGGANPDDTALLTSANWDLDASSVKHTAGVAIKST
jgi:hypothetical protein